MSEQLSTTFMAIADYAVATGQAPIKDKVWKVRLDDHWEFAVSGMKEPQIVRMEGSDTEHTLDPFHAYVEFNGWPAGVFSPYGGSFAAGEMANEQTFCEALKKAARCVK